MTRTAFRTLAAFHAFLAVAALLTGAPVSAPAEHREARHRDVAAGETLDETLLATGESVTIDGVVEGDVLAVARRVVVRGTIRGSLYALAQQVDVDGVIEGSLHVLGQQTEVRGRVEGTVLALGQRFELLDGGRLERDGLILGQRLHLRGSVGRDLWVAVQSLRLAGSVGRHLRAQVDRLDVESAARVGGDLRTRIADRSRLHIASGATIGGRTVTKIVAGRTRRSRFMRPGFYVWEAVKLLGALFVGLLLFSFAPRLYAPAESTARSSLKALGVGFLVLVAVPVGALILAVTLVGLPVAFIVLGAYALGLYLAKIVVGAWIGRLLFRGPAERVTRFAFVLLIGLLVLTLAGFVPILGGWVRFLVILLGLGTLLLQLRLIVKSTTAPSSSAATPA